MMNLYELSNQYDELLNYMQSVDVTTEDQKETFENTLESLDTAIEDKAENIVHVLNQLKYDEDVVTQEINRLQAKRTALRNNQRSLRDYLMNSMLFLGKEKIRTPLFNIYTQNSPARMVVSDETNIPPEFFEVREPKLDKARLREYIKDNEVQGVHMEQGKHLRFR